MSTAFQEIVKKAVEKAGSQVNLAKTLNFHQSMVCCWLKGKGTPAPHNREKIEKFLSINQSNVIRALKEIKKAGHLAALKELLPHVETLAEDIDFVREILKTL